MSTLRLALLTLLLPMFAACGGASTGGSESSTGTAAPSGGSSGASALYREGTHYQRLAQPIQAQANEVAEVFSYACPACGQFQPEVDTWKRERGDAVVLRYVPADFQPAWEPFARAFHTAQELGALSRLHRTIFNGMNQPGRRMANIADVADLVAESGIDRQRFLDTAQSPAVDAALARSREFVQKAGVRSTPTLIVSGRYRVERTQVGGVSPFAIVDWLIEHQP